MPDWEASGLLDDVPDAERPARAELLDALHADGATVEQLREATAAGRLALLPLERRLGEGRRWTMRDAAERCGLSVDYLALNHRSLGLPEADPDDVVYTDQEVENLEVSAGLLQAGMEEEAVHRIARVLGQSGRLVAEALADGVTGGLARPDDTETDIARRYVALADALLPRMDLVVGSTVRMHLLDVVRRETVGHVERVTGRAAGTREIAVAFVDMSGFTAMSDQVELERLGALAERFESCVGDAVRHPVRFVKMLGDGAMLVSPDPRPLVEEVLEVVEAMRRHGLPPAHAGVAVGPALPSGGDWYGRTVNVAARLCAAAGPGVVLATTEVREEAGDVAVFEPHGPLELRGIDDPVDALAVRSA